ncbi:RNA pyrophosphohydrolase [Leptospira wolffii]|uniref:RNA pyrophosphohydrolase n=1 Tax=Leptospira wolffii TaxID=409998 RepID=A0A2M9ZDT3_9LEPT|nr:RNA pyrophosphohydrolase [Leptospira wolffii]EPG64955.1 putative RNA pyrophosphohydrolase [Leptospira wolffii serovar Khorat str. Khorat-H2]PJZ66576.1 RNA pyrophosphohydrolase [Leptospira wolffii]TGL52435.1 RNA pyrophosphohydrolase [Leptospira wolffii]
MDKPYRKNVGMVVFNSKGEVLVGERHNFKGSWQFPQGGIDEGEEPLPAAKRELYEEVGISDSKLVSEYPEWIHYDFPESLHLTSNLKKYKGQTQKWFLLYWNGKAEDCDLEIHEREFDSVRFIPFQDCLSTVVSFKRDVYEKLVSEFAPKIKEYILQIKP